MPWTSDSETRLRGRRAESEALDRLITSARAGASGALVLRGEAGVGKTALLDHLLAHAVGCRIVRAAGVESEMELAFAGLHQLCAPFLDRLDHLPAPQGDALGTAFGLTTGGAPDRFLVGLAVLGLLSDVAEAQPLICLLDDAQWLDDASAQVLGFVARRLGAEALVLVFALREPGENRNLAGLPELVVQPLRDADARALLAEAIPGKLDESVRDRIVAEACGNPLALLELPRAWTPAGFAGGYGLPDGISVSGRIEESFRRRLTSLPDDTRQLLLLMAAEPVGDPTLVWAAADRLGIAEEASLSASATGLLDVGALLRFRHPLVRSVVYRDAAPEDRRAVHGALAAATDVGVDPDRRAWHLAAAADGPDEDIARELELSAGRAQARGGLAASAAFLQRALALTGDPARRADRALAAAEASLKAGEFDAALELVAAAETEPLDTLARARVDLLHAQIAYAHNRGDDAPPLLLRAAQTLETLDVRLSRDTYLDAWGAALFAGRLARSGGLRDVSLAVATGPPAADPPRPCDLLLDGFALVFTEGRLAATPVLERAVAGFAGDDISVEEVLRWGWLATAAAAYLWDLESCLTVANREVELARSVGALEVLAVGVNVLGQAVSLSGDFVRAGLLIAEADSVREATGTQVGPYGGLVLAGLRGRESEAIGLVAATISDATAGGQGTAVQYAHWANAVLMNGLGRYEEALAAAIEASDDTPELFVSMWSLSELIEAAARTRDHELAVRGARRLAEHTRASEAAWALGLESRGRALVSDGQTAEALYRQAIDHFEPSRLRPELARSHLLYGEWLRREGRRIDARSQLKTAYDLFSSIGMEAFMERARQELQATGETVRRRTPNALDELTPQEIQIARLASDGRTNHEIAAQLFLSPRTVEWHLRKVFPKLGVASRRELQAALPPHMHSATRA